ncbi:MAG: signal recognition particle-docking protein FtsY [Ruminococcus sp.]|nr:signal recognition particle-docking protein FtsY [Ruminococcus sp.]
MSIFSKLAAGLRKTKDSFLGGLQRIFNSFTAIDEELFEELEEQMIMSDIGVDTSVYICEQLRKKVRERGETDPQRVLELIQEVIAEIMGDDTGLDLSVSPAVIMVIGVNGAGKTTTIGKLCHQFKQEGKKVIVAAADTFRAAAIEQLQVWTERAGVDIVKHAEGSDPGAVVYDAIDAAKARGCDVVIIDTAGRLHNKKNLMDELAKINRIIDNRAGDCSREVLLVLDATTGQNAVNQAKLFSETAPITGIVLTKLDGTAKGGIVISIKNELGIPVKLIGVGEKIDDLQPFDSHMFVDALFDLDYTEDEETEENGETEENAAAESGTEEYEPAGYYNEYGLFIPYEDTDEEYDESEEYDEPDDTEAAEEDEAADEDTAAENAEFPEDNGETEVNSEEDTEPGDAAEDGTEAEPDDSGEADETDDGDTEQAEDEPVKKKKGFFSRLFGRKDDDDDN